SLVRRPSHLAQAQTKSDAFVLELADQRPQLRRVHEGIQLVVLLPVQLLGGNSSMTDQGHVVRSDSLPPLWRGFFPGRVRIAHGGLPGSNFLWSRELPYGQGVQGEPVWCWSRKSP